MQTGMQLYLIFSCDVYSIGHHRHVRGIICTVKFIAVNYSEKNCRKFYREKILRKIFAHIFANRVMYFFARKFSRKFFNFFFAKSFSWKHLRKFFRQNLEKIFFAEYFSSYLCENNFRENICANVFTKNFHEKNK